MQDDGPSTPSGSTPSSSSSPSGKKSLTGKRTTITRPDDNSLPVAQPKEPLIPSSTSSEVGTSSTAVEGRDPTSGAGDEEEDETNLRFEDPFADEVEEEDVAEMEGGEHDEVGGAEEGRGKELEEGLETSGMDEEEDEDDKPKQIWRPGVDTLGPNEVLEYDSSAYDMLHPMNVEWPCLSFDILVDKLGFERTKFPHTMYLVAGTQAQRGHASGNTILLLKASQLHRTKHDDDPEAEEDDDDDLDDDPIVEFKTVKHPGAINRIRAMRSKPEIVASWSEEGDVHIWDLQRHLRALDVPPTTRLQNPTPLQSFKHSTEGFALDWSTTKEGRLITGDCNRALHLWEPAPGGRWQVDATPFAGHEASVEDLQWSPNEENVFASCSVDRTIKIWDARVRTRPGLSVAAHHCDVNVISWNKKVPYLMLSGADDGTFSIWDLRNFKSHQPAAHFKWHKGAITSVEWHPTDESVLAVSSEDNQVTTWDMSLEADAEDMAAATLDYEKALPPQLLFVHMGQKEVKEIHWHPQIPGVIVSTASEGFNLYKTCNI